MRQPARRAAESHVRHDLRRHAAQQRIGGRCLAVAIAVQGHRGSRLRAERRLHHCRPGVGLAIGPQLLRIAADDDRNIAPDATGMGGSVAMRQDVTVQVELFPREAGVDVRRYRKVERGRVDLIRRQCAQGGQTRGARWQLEPVQQFVAHGLAVRRAARSARRCRLHNRALEQSIGQRRVGEEQRVRSACRTAADGHARRIATEGADIGLYPLKRSDLVEQAIVGRRAMRVFLAQRFQSKGIRRRRAGTVS